MRLLRQLLRCAERARGCLSLPHRSSFAGCSHAQHLQGRDVSKNNARDCEARAIFLHKTPVTVLGGEDLADVVGEDVGHASSNGLLNDGERLALACSGLIHHDRAVHGSSRGNSWSNYRKNRCYEPGAREMGVLPRLSGAAVKLRFIIAGMR